MCHPMTLTNGVCGGRGGASVIKNMTHTENALKHTEGVRTKTMSPCATMAVVVPCHRDKSSLLALWL